jgi:hypothetical protein
MSTESQDFEGWAIVELMGHRKLAGYVSLTELGGASFLRLDIPKQDDKANAVATQYYNPSALYCLTPVVEEVARAFAKNSHPQPVTRWEVPQLFASSRETTKPSDFARESLPIVDDDEDDELENESAWDEMR